MFKIGDFSRLGQVSVRMLRHYDQLGLLTPNHTDAFTGYRYYTLGQLARLNRIVALKELGFSLEQVGQLLEQSHDLSALSAEKLRGMLTLRRAELERELRDKRTQLTEVEARLQQIEHEGQPSPYEIVVKPLPAQSIASLRQMVPHMSEMGYYCQQMYAALYAALRRVNSTPLQPETTLYHTDEYRETDLDVETAVAVQPNIVRQPPASDDLAFRELPPVELAAALIYEGPFADMTPAIFALLAYVGTHRHTLAGPLRQVHLTGPVHDAEGRVQTNPVVELQIPIQKIDS